MSDFEQELLSEIKTLNRKLDRDVRQDLLDEIKSLNGKLDRVIRQNDDIKRLLTGIKLK